MTSSIKSKYSHVHDYGRRDRSAERRTRAVVWITAIMMIVEIAAGWWFNSMAVLADGWHMGSHALAIGISAIAYAAARRWANDERFAFGTWKIEVLGGYTSAIMLLGAAVLMIVASVERLVSPEPIRYREAFLVAIVGLAVNLVSAFILGGAHDHGHGHDHGHDDADEHHHDHDAADGNAARRPEGDLNLKSAYLHVIADAATSVLAMIALLGGMFFGWQWLDPAMGIVGAILIAAWARGLLVDTGKILVDREMDHPIVGEINEVIASLPGARTRIADLHVWRVGNDAYSCAVSLTTDDPDLTPDDVRRALSVHQEIVHTTVEINQG